MMSTMYASIGHCALCYLGPWRVLEKNLYIKKVSKIRFQQSDAYT